MRGHKLPVQGVLYEDYRKTHIKNQRARQSGSGSIGIGVDLLETDGDFSAKPEGTPEVESLDPTSANPPTSDPSDPVYG